MKPCDEVRELIPWYVEGTLDAEEARDVASHVAACEACVLEVAEAVRLRTEVRQALDGLPRLSEGVWNRVHERAGGRRIAQLDVGSFLLGFRLGASIVRGWIPMRGDLQVLGRNIKLFERRKGGSR
ncbi:MAG: zf-HC2 domain-containing protein [Candidatus Bipolaricaulota bacterium]|nr:zf-HC2 domain-containing protein [Candidatus Bipolaricaulota bacterium]